MKILGIQTSPNQDGLTAQTANNFLMGAQENGAEVELVHLNEIIIKKCKACDGGWGQCRREGICILKDDFQSLRKKIEDANMLVFASPVYWHDISESAKTFLDRLRRCETHYGFENYKSKTAVGIASAGGSGNGAARALYNLEDYLKRLGFRIFDLVTITKNNKGHKLPMLIEAGKRAVTLV
jgi:multimeric flavodoxin WrbA